VDCCFVIVFIDIDDMNKVLKSIRGFLDELSFVEVETPILSPLAGGANANPFVTKYVCISYDSILLISNQGTDDHARELTLRIAPELYLKQCLVGGLERGMSLLIAFL